MPSLADIPPQFMREDKFFAFSIWLKSLAIHRDPKKEILFLWAREFNLTIPADQVLDILGPEL
ncbi:hypothetical protein KAR91_71915 [Candidatus Pacearchaeota archaeon]|nr:hypothetical protein [Candidatus Pacearchaeota archaeon]